MARPRVLVISRNFPSPAVPTLGLWVQRMVEVGASSADTRVVAPVPWTPPFVPLPEEYARYRRVPERTETTVGRVPVHHPRVFLLPGSRFQFLEDRLFFPPVMRLASRLHSENPFDLIHAHFIYPDGVVAARIGRELGIPVVTTEHAHWLPWMEERTATWRRVESALPDIHTVTTVSRAVERGVRELAGDAVRTEVLPNVVDDDVFVPGENPAQKVPDRILFVGVIRRVKGFDVLVRAMKHLAEIRPAARLHVVGEPFYRSYRKDFQKAMELAEELGVRDRIEFRGAASPEGVAAAMREASVLVVPSRRESFSSVAAEALACGTPVVATRCGGPEEIVTPETGVLVPPEDPKELARALEFVLANAASYDTNRLWAHAVERFGRDAARRRLESLYGRVLGGVPATASLRN